MKALEVTVKGKVQGVYFRASAKQKAMNLGVYGSVRNQADGSVILQIEGEERAVDSMVSWCKSGPALARVKECEVQEGPLHHNPTFEILH